MLGSLLTGIGSIVGGLLGGEESSKGKKKSLTRSRSTTKHTVRLGQLVKQAERAGFKPLPVLNAGGLAAYTKPQTSGFSKTKEKFSGSSQSSSPGAAVAGALNAVGGMMQTDGNALSENAAGAWQAPTGQPAGADELALVNAQLSSAEPVLRPPVSATYSATPVLSKDDKAAGPQSDWIKPTFNQPEVTNPFPESSGIKVDKTIPDASAWSDRYGEGGEFIGGLYVAANDMAKNWQPSVDQFTNHDLPKITNYIGNLWDPPAISSFLPPIVRSEPKPALRLGSGGGW